MAVDQHPKLAPSFPCRTLQCPTGACRHDTVPFDPLTIRCDCGYRTAVNAVPGFLRRSATDCEPEHSSPNFGDGGDHWRKRGILWPDPSAPDVSCR